MLGLGEVQQAIGLYTYLIENCHDIWEAMNHAPICLVDLTLPHRANFVE